MKQRESGCRGDFNQVCRVIHGKGRHIVDARLLTCGQDIVVIINGGEAPHIGAAVLAVPRPSLSDPAQISASASVLCVTGHKDDEVARKLALRLASEFHCVTAVIAGIHIEQALEEDIEILKRNCDIVADKLLIRLRENN